MPLQFENGVTRKTLNLTGAEKISLRPLGELRPSMKFDMVIEYADGKTDQTTVLSRVDTEDELNYFKNGGILQYVLRNLAN